MVRSGLCQSVGLNPIAVRWEVPEISRESYIRALSNFKSLGKGGCALDMVNALVVVTQCKHTVYGSNFFVNYGY